MATDSQQMLRLDLDESTLNDACDGDEEFLAELLETFIDCQDAAMLDLMGAMQDGDLSSATKIAHFTKSGARSIGAFRLADVAEDLEKAAKSGDDSVGQLVDEFYAAYAKLKSVINQRQRL